MTTAQERHKIRREVFNVLDSVGITYYCNGVLHGECGLCSGGGIYGGSGDVPPNVMATMIGAGGTSFNMDNEGTRFIKLGDISASVGGDGLTAYADYAAIGNIFGDNDMYVASGSDIGGNIITSPSSRLHQTANTDWQINSGSFTITDTRVTKVGIVYSGDYSADYNDLSLVNKGYVNSQIVRYTQGNRVSGTTDSNGILTVAHGIPYGPWVVVATVHGAPYVASVVSMDATNFVFEIRDVSAGGALVNTGAVTIHWISIKEG